MIMGNALWQLIKQSDTVSKLVLLILLAMSIACWTVFFYKIFLLRTKMRNLAAAREHMKQIFNFEQLLESVPVFIGTIPGYFLSRNLTFLKSMLAGRKDTDVAGLSKHQWELMENNIDQTVHDMIIHEEAYMSVLSTSVAVAPLLGLFGTIWGLIHSFVRISQQQTADIAIVAPGIAEALITTLAGLMVAIPAVIMFSYINGYIRNIEHQLLHFADQCTVVLQQHLMR